ncbi:MAG: sugar phosphate isomerase/epimerase [Mycobacterium sp.]|nr:sugar phosphate isomerase/epimerase [Mycobacterium sp.]
MDERGQHFTGTGASDEPGSHRRTHHCGGRGRVQRSGPDRRRSRCCPGLVGLHSHEVRDLLFEAADALAPAFIKIGSEPGPRTSYAGALVAPLRDLAAQAAEHGTRVAIETMPFSAIATVPMGADIVAAAAHPAAGLLIDAWHVFRAGTSLAELRESVAPEMIFGVELDDAHPDVIGTLFEDTVQRRLLCGDGCFDLPGLIQLLRDKGFDGPWGVEILSETFRALPVGEALKLAADTARGVL